MQTSPELKAKVQAESGKTNGARIRALSRFDDLVDMLTEELLRRRFAVTEIKIVLFALLRTFKRSSCWVTIGGGIRSLAAQLGTSREEVGAALEHLVDPVHGNVLASDRSGRILRLRINPDYENWGQDFHPLLSDKERQVLRQRVMVDQEDLQMLLNIVQPDLDDVLPEVVLAQVLARIESSDGSKVTEVPTHVPAQRALAGEDVAEKPTHDAPLNGNESLAHRFEKSHLTNDSVTGTRQSERERERELVSRVAGIVGDDVMETWGGDWRKNYVRKMPLAVERACAEADYKKRTGFVPNKGWQPYLKDLVHQFARIGRYRKRSPGERRAVSAEKSSAGTPAARVQSECPDEPGPLPGTPAYADFMNDLAQNNQVYRANC